MTGADLLNISYMNARLLAYYTVAAVAISIVMIYLYSPRQTQTRG